MSTYLVGDIHGCYYELQAILDQVNFNSSKDTLWITGDLVSRGPNSLEVLRYIKNLGPAAKLVLGNHDLHLIAIYIGIKQNKKFNKLNNLLQAPDIDELIHWLRSQPLLQIDESKKIIMVHAGINPQWNIITAKKCAKKLENVLSSNHYKKFFDYIIGYNTINYWSDKLDELSRLRFISNAFTRMRYCLPNGQLDFLCKLSPNNAPLHLKPWFMIPNSSINNYTIFFGHWSSLVDSNILKPNNIIGLDTGCCWGGKLTMFHLETMKFIQQKSFSSYVIEHV